MSVFEDMTQNDAETRYFEADSRMSVFEARERSFWAYGETAYTHGRFASWKIMAGPVFLLEKATRKKENAKNTSPGFEPETSRSRVRRVSGSAITALDQIGAVPARMYGFHVGPPSFRFLDTFALFRKKVVWPSMAI